MRVLIACEYSGVVREAFSRKGHYAMSCDLLPSEAPGEHYQGDVLDILGDGWDLMVAHPPCTYLSASGMHWTTRGLRDPALTEQALDFVRLLLDAPIERVALENPVGAISSRIRKPTQIIQPWMWGDDASKRTCLWLRNLPPLVPDWDRIVPPRGWQRVRYALEMTECQMCGEPYCEEHADHYGDCECIGPTQNEATFKTIDGVQFATLMEPTPRPVWANQTPSGQNKLGPSADRWKVRSATYQGIANAMAEQWGGGVAHD